MANKVNLPVALQQPGRVEEVVKVRGVHRGQTHHESYSDDEDQPGKGEGRQAGKIIKVMKLFMSSLACTAAVGPPTGLPSPSLPLSLPRSHAS